jgi:hypothetical protein
MPAVVCTKNIVINMKLHHFILFEIMLCDTQYVRKKLDRRCVESHHISILCLGYSDDKSEKHFDITLDFILDWPEVKI